MPFKRNRRGDAKYATPQHRAARARLVKAFKPGDPCCLCGKPMMPAPDGTLTHLHADHVPGTNDYRGLAHADCNIRDGARRGRARQNTKAVNRRW